MNCSRYLTKCLGTANDAEDAVIFLFTPLYPFCRYMLRRVLLELKSGHVVDLGYGIAAFVPQVALEEGADRGIVKFFLQLVKQEGTVVQAG